MGGGGAAPLLGSPRSRSKRNSRYTQVRGYNCRWCIAATVIYGVVSSSFAKWSVNLRVTRCHDAARRGAGEFGVAVKGKLNCDVNSLWPLLDRRFLTDAEPLRPFNDSDRSDQYVRPLIPSYPAGLPGDTCSTSVFVRMFPSRRRYGLRSLLTVFRELGQLDFPASSLQK